MYVKAGTKVVDTPAKLFSPVFHCQLIAPLPLTVAPAVRPVEKSVCHLFMCFLRFKFLVYSVFPLITIEYIIRYFVSLSYCKASSHETHCSLELGHRASRCSNAWTSFQLP